MDDPNNERVCSRCGKKIPASAAEGWCTCCLLAAAATASEGPGTTRGGWVPPSITRVAPAFPNLEIVELIGVGGMGAVYRARQPKLDRWVALKLLPEGSGCDPAFGERFLREARVLARLSHPNIVGVYDFGQNGEFCYLLMEYVDGVNLRQAMRAGKFSPTQALALVPQVCSALQFAHNAGVMHRDIKPENILLDAQGRVKLADFGIAKMLGEPTGDPALTLTGTSVGTPQYMAPEQIEHPADVDHRADIYSLGVVFYELLTGELPLGRFAAPSAKTPLDARIDDIVLRALAKEREMRQQSADEVRTAVERVGVGFSAAVPSSKHPTHSGPSPVPDLDSYAAPIFTASLDYRRAVLGLTWAFLALAPFLFAPAVAHVWRPIQTVWFDVSHLQGAGPLAGLLVCGLGCWFLIRRTAMWLAPVVRLSRIRSEPLNRGIGIGLVLSSLTMLMGFGFGVFGSVSSMFGRWAEQGSEFTNAMLRLWMASFPLLFVWGWRRGSRAYSREDLVSPGPMPRSAEWVALSMLAYAVLASLAVVLRRSDGITVLLGGGEYAIPVCLAWWSRSRFWRGMAQVISAYTVATLLIAAGMWLYWTVQGTLPTVTGEVPTELGEMNSWWVFLAVFGSLILHAAALASFNGRQARRTFGLPERHPNPTPAATETSKSPA
jgi:predicted Ser/Thr protein kinase